MRQQIKTTWKAVMRGRHNILRSLSNTRHANGRSSNKRRKPVPMLSGASKCVWQMDREA